MVVGIEWRIIIFDGLTITIRLAGSALFFSGNREYVYLLNSTNLVTLFIHWKA